ncbi:MAG: cytosine deaminase [Phycisphaerales bacterium]|nr:cytosine deaminase [Phycisphaerales bacterium]
MMDRSILDTLMEAAYQQALKGYNEGGLPIGSVLADRRGIVLAVGHNLRVQTGDPTAHAEVACIRSAGRRRDWPDLVLVSSLSPCVMCTGTALLYKIPEVVIGENENFLGAEDLFAARGVRVTNLQHAGCKELMARFVRERPDLWNEDIGVPPGAKPA